MPPMTAGQEESPGHAGSPREGRAGTCTGSTRGASSSSSSPSSSSRSMPSSPTQPSRRGQRAAVPSTTHSHVVSDADFARPVSRSASSSSPSLEAIAGGQAAEPASSGHTATVTTVISSLSSAYVSHSASSGSVLQASLLAKMIIDTTKPLPPSSNCMGEKEPQHHHCKHYQESYSERLRERDEGYSSDRDSVGSQKSVLFCDFKERSSAGLHGGYLPPPHEQLASSMYSISASPHSHPQSGPGGSKKSKSGENLFLLLPHWLSSNLQFIDPAIRPLLTTTPPCSEPVERTPHPVPSTQARSNPSSRSSSCASSRAPTPTPTAGSLLAHSSSNPRNQLGGIAVATDGVSAGGRGQGGVEHTPTARIGSSTLSGVSVGQRSMSPLAAESRGQFVSIGQDSVSISILQEQRSMPVQSPRPSALVWENDWGHDAAANSSSSSSMAGGCPVGAFPVPSSGLSPGRIVAVDSSLLSAEPPGL